MANAEKVTRTEIVTVGVELSLSLDEAGLLKSILGSIGSTDTSNRDNKVMALDMWVALQRAGIVSVGYPFVENEVRLR